MATVSSSYPRMKTCPLSQHEPALGVLVVELAVVRGDQLVDVSELLRSLDGRVEDPVTLHVVLHTSSEQFVVPPGRIEALDEVPVPRVVPGSEVQNGICVEGDAAVLQVQPGETATAFPVVLRLQDLVVHPQHEIPEDVVTRSG